MTKTEVIDQLQDLICDRESFLGGTDDDIFCRDIAALKAAIELIENGESPEDQIWIRRNPNGKIDKVSHVVDEGISERVWFEEVNSVGAYTKSMDWKITFLNDPAWSLANASDLIKAYAKMFRSLNNISEKYLNLRKSFESSKPAEKYVRVDFLEGNQKHYLEVSFTDRSSKVIEDGYKWKISGDFIYVFDVTNRPVAMFRSEDVRAVIDIEG